MKKIDPTNQGTQLPKRNTTGAKAPERTTAELPAANLKKIQELSSVPGFFDADNNNCRDLKEYDLALGLKQSKTKTGEIIFTETIKSADDKLAVFIEDSDETFLVPGDQFLSVLLQTTAPQIESPLGYFEKIRTSKEALPFYEFSTADALNRLDSTTEAKYKKFIAEKFKAEIQEYINGSKTANADDYIDRIRRVLRVNARKIINEPLPRDLAEAWQKASLENKKLSRRAFIGASGLSGLAAAAFVAYGDAAKDVSEQREVIDNLTNKSILNGDTFKSQNRELIEGKLISDEATMFNRIANILSEIMTKKGYPESYKPHVFSTTNQPGISNIDIFKTQESIHFRIPQETFIEILELNKPEKKVNSLNRKFIEERIKINGFLPPMKEV